ncbi:SRPBCC family protein [Pseudofrankia inefficax]|uniref:Activator of Hsp90 ATPase 1 family protein n=1 Tax=Pseudofrankia inefficax (strain DSM 45817 / CECT 9037 / DDB 130130 / EuI1c) TaxID=298654 RepID=E3JD74_PSEI1|nr:SRPBCC domain-containing protein [Pseudofrankia inefficax]ADP82358.1 Activator of Hsp90 ATPase 1 family protein [Pseudofrankia inefficax]
MPDILHRISIDAPTARVHELIATADGIARWWTGRPLDGSAEIGGTVGVYFGAAEKPAAVMRIVTVTPNEITWHVVEGPDSWVGTRITFTLRPRGEDATTLLFAHTGWREASEFMSGCSTNWGSYLTSLKTGAESGQFAAYPHGEISRWN